MPEAPPNPHLRSFRHGECDGGVKLWALDNALLFLMVHCGAKRFGPDLKNFQKQQHQYQLVHPFKACVLAQTAGLLGSNLEMTEAGQIYITAIQHRVEVLKLENIM